MTAQESDSVVLLQNQKTGQNFYLRKKKITLGAVVSADVQISGDGVSPIHAVIELLSDVLDPENTSNLAVIYDLASDTGTYVNQKRVVQQKIKKGDEVRIADSKFVLKVEKVSSLKHAQRPLFYQGSSSEEKLLVSPSERLKPFLLDENRNVEAIFLEGEKQSTQKDRRTLEVTFSWKGTILNIGHFCEPPQVTIGSRKGVDFSIPPVLSQKKVFPLLSRDSSGYYLNIHSEMAGVICQGDQVIEIGKLGKNSSTRQGKISFDEDDYAKISVRDMDFYITNSPPTPRLKPPRLFEKDPLYRKVLGTSIGITLLLTLLLFNTRVHREISVDQLPKRVASVLFQPEKYSTVPSSRLGRRQGVEASSRSSEVQVQKRISHGGKGEGSAKKGDAGIKGAPQANLSTVRQNKLGRVRKNYESQNLEGFSGVQSQVKNILGQSLNQLGKNGQKLKGFGGFETLGASGLGSTGVGQSAGGVQSRGRGQGNRGGGAAEVGVGLGAKGTGSEIIGDRAQLVIRSGGSEEAVVMGAIDPGEIEAALMKYRDSFKYCYEREINAGQPQLNGRLVTSFVINAGGRVSEAGVSSSTLDSPRVESCILGVIKRIPFPKPRGGGVVQVSYPFRLRAVNP